MSRRQLTNKQIDGVSAQIICIDEDLQLKTGEEE
jgi:hypothetical protein